MSEITSASQEQSSGIEQVNQAISQMDEMTQQNAALVEQAAAAAQSMQDQAVELSRAVSIFRLNGNDPVAPASPQRPPQHAPARQQSKPAGKAIALSAAATPKLSGKPLKPITADRSGDDWEEF